MKKLYRISDASNPTKQKFWFATKKNCLENFLKCFGANNTTIFADNVSDKTYEWLSDYNFSLKRTNSSGDSGSFRLLLEEALTFPDDEYVYFVEDDYLHLKDSKLVLQEGLLMADYVSLYDHWDKYIPPLVGGNPQISDAGEEETKVYITQHSHWKLTNSTTFCFATRIKTLKEDQDIFFKATEAPTCQDYAAFQTLISKGRLVATPIPGRSTHCEINWASPLIDWSKVV